MINSNLNITKPTYLEREFSFKNKEKQAGNLEKKLKSNPKTENSTNNELTEAEKKQVEELKKIDRQVKAHEQAHLNAAAGIASGGASYTYTLGPDGQRYATGGEVQIDISPEKDPKATIQKMQQVRRAALAPSDPSGQDRSVAAQATNLEARAIAELNNPDKNSDSKLIDTYNKVNSESKFSIYV